MVCSYNGRNYVEPEVSLNNGAMAFDLQDFVNVMIQKLNKNMHKQEIPLTVPQMVELLTRELGEFLRQYMEDAKDPNAEKELADIANFAFLIFMKLRGNR